MLTNASDTDEDDDLFWLRNLKKSASTSLNTFVHMLVIRIPQNRLRRFAWTHPYLIEMATIRLLFVHHSQSLQEISIHSGMPWAFEEVGRIPNLRRLDLPSIDVEDTKWPMLLLGRDMTRVKHLTIGTEAHLAAKYCSTGDFRSASAWYASTVVDHLYKNLQTSMKEDSHEVPSLTSVRLDRSAR